MNQILKIDPETTISVRSVVLRPNRPIETCYFDGDNLPTTTHFGYYTESELVGIVSVFQKNNSTWDSKSQLQIRGMAVLPSFQQKGIGESLLKQAISFALENEIQLIWFNARKNAVPFYEKNGFHKIGAAFEIESVGTHYLMYRQL